MRRFTAWAALLVALASSSSLSAAPKIGVLLKGTSPFWNAAGQGATEAGKSHGAEIIVKMPVMESDIAVQIQMLEALVKDGINALVIAPCNPAALSDPVTAAMAKGVKVVVIDTPVEAEMPVYIGTNHTNAGDAAGRLLASLLQETDEVAILKHSRTIGATTLREASAFAALHQVHPKMVVTRDIFSGTDASKQVENAHLLLQQHPNTKGVLASGTPGSTAMLRALQESGRAGAVKFVGFGFNLNPTVATALENGAMHGWIAQLPSEIGGRGIDAALALLAGKPVAEVSFCDFLVITKSNLHEPRVQALLPPVAAAR